MPVERRQLADRRKVHIFVSDERRKGPFDRRGAESRRLSQVREREKIEKFQSFKKQQEASAPTASPMLTKKQLFIVGLALLLLVVVLFGIN